MRVSVYLSRDPYVNNALSRVCMYRQSTGYAVTHTRKLWCYLVHPGNRCLVTPSYRLVTSVWKPAASVCPVMSRTWRAAIGGWRLLPPMRRVSSMDRVITEFPKNPVKKGYIALQDRKRPGKWHEDLLLMNGPNL
jgi:hypothetical protein